jgi:hypothetical protein
MTVSAEIAQQITEKTEYGQAICTNIAERIAKLGFTDTNLVKPPQFSDAVFSLVTDPFTQTQDLVGFWYNESKQRVGQIKFHGDGSFYAEYDVVQPHPKKKQWFVEAINAWGQRDNIKSDAKLLDIPQ